jgi:tRNA A37 threonylcarbamoyladenosine synthetase subunit TsaC/SUA5/YrdC
MFGSKRRRFAPILRRRRGGQTCWLEETSPLAIAERLADGQIGVLDWGRPDHMIFVLVGRADRMDVVRRMNRIKGRPEDQVLALAGFADMAPVVADLSAAPPLHRAAQRSLCSREELVRRLFCFPVGVVLPALPTLPSPILDVSRPRDPTVLLAGESWTPEFGSFIDMYNAVVRELWASGILLAGTSANRRDEDTYSIHQQAKLWADLGESVDFAVMRREQPPRMCSSCFASSTILDLTKAEVVVRRHGSIHPERFRSILCE